MILVVLKELGQFEGQFRSNFPEKFQIFGITPVNFIDFLISGLKSSGMNRLK